jgi:Flp pilus assembly pilin Flp
MFDLTHGILFVFFSTTLIISILVVVNSIANKFNKQKEELNEAQKSIEQLNKGL